MSVPYERYTDEIEAAEQSSLSSEETATHSEPAARPDVLILQRKHRKQEIFKHRWPLQIGVVQLVTGFFIGILGAVVVIVLPLVLVQATSNSKNPIKFNLSNLWGVGLWSGALLVITGSLGIRAALNQSVTTVYTYFGSILLDLFVFIAILLMMIIKAADFYGEFAVHGPKAPLYITQLVVNIMIVIGFLVILIAFTQYYEDVFCGELQCLRRALHCCLPCWCPRVVEPEELMAENAGRPPSLPI